MSVECAHCGVYACRAGRLDATPDNCPMLGDFPAFSELYAADEARLMAYESTRIEAEGYCRWTRTREIVEFARRMGYERLGIAHCVDMAREARLVAGFLSRHSIEAILPPETFDCDPEDQATFFADRNTDLNVVAGMHVAHEALFLDASHAPVTCLVARDPRLRHNPVACLYTSGGYLQEELFNADLGSKNGGLRGNDAAVLREARSEIPETGESASSRLTEAMRLARRLGATHLGLTFCVGFRNEAALLIKVLEARGFRVSSACCKTGSVPKERLGILDAEKVRPGGPEMICNSRAQAELLNREGVELTLLLGQCVGHDSATIDQLDSPAACLVVKDRVLAHNSVAALYETER